VRAAYGAAKAGVVLLTKSVASQYGSRGIRCNAVVPGLVLTPAVDHVTPEQIEASLERYPMPRLGEPEDVANAVLFLASDEAGFVNVTTLMVEGGATIYMPGGAAWPRARRTRVSAGAPLWRRAQPDAPGPTRPEWTR
jgi:NAD(P)-dependent dehydrogenase (short-subunit alcohol dehydrogenase family)